MGGWTALIEVLKRPTEGDAWMEFVFFLGSLWVVVLFVIFTGWTWKPRWACLAREKFDGGKISNMASLPSIAMGLISSFSSFVLWISEGKNENLTFEMTEPMKSDNGKLKIEENEKVLVTKEDLEYLCQLVEERDEGSAWQQMMEQNLEQHPQQTKKTPLYIWVLQIKKNQEEPAQNGRYRPYYEMTKKETKTHLEDPSRL